MVYLISTLFVEGATFYDIYKIKDFNVCIYVGIMDGNSLRIFPPNIHSNPMIDHRSMEAAALQTDPKNFFLLVGGLS